jgi:hypothetical protein
VPVASDKVASAEPHQPGASGPNFDRLADLEVVYPSGDDDMGALGLATIQGRDEESQQDQRTNPGGGEKAGDEPPPGRSRAHLPSPLGSAPGHAWLV